MALTPSQRATARKSLGAQLAAATVADRHDEVLRIVASGGPELICTGLLLDASSALMSYAQFCIDKGHVEALAKVVAARPGGVTLADCCIVEEGTVYGVTVSTTYDPVKAALERCDVALVNVLLDARAHLPTELSLRRDIDFMHLRTLRKLLGFTLAEEAPQLGALCRHFVRRSIPLLDKDGPASLADELVINGSWHQQRGADEVTQLLRDYAAAGTLRVDDVVDIKWRHVGNCRLLLAAIKKGCTPLVCELIDMGCDWRLAIGPKAPDLPTAIRSFGREGDAELAAAAAEALMRVRLRNLAAQQAATAQPATARRRAVL
ncbi:hypothetical protein [Methylibium petroleiphilum]|uniref:Uncharacterized protein n=1 Tax=Methylibium petroleiphilum (strain ATCC BAA-1232 / LMG 22953 / PM1) TaxID=420662 RepID=A2SPB9_METPP|nr:hypothetical protein [Methylibium petroleiphilum]ABM97408.1 hypothetical protein Mpe_B0644 [Methylibium petroleiphilum PM1]